MLTSFNALTNLISWVQEDEPSVQKTPDNTFPIDANAYPGFNADDLKPLCSKDSSEQIIYDCEESDALRIQFTSVNELFERS